MPIRNDWNAELMVPASCKAPVGERARLSGDSHVATLEVALLRRQFPALAREVYPGIPLVYLDNAATTQMPSCVIEAVAQYYRAGAANVHRGLHRLAEQATEAFEAAREKVARFIGAASARQVIFTRGATESINLVAWSWGQGCIAQADEILVTQMEHHSNLIPWQQVAAATGTTIRFVPILDDGRLDLEALEGLLGPKTKLVAVTAASNVLGTINPIEQITEMAHASGARVLVDGAQSLPHLPCDVQAWDCDFLAFSGHKMCGPEGVGVLYGKAELLEAMPPFMTGGEMVRRVRWTSTEWNELPWKFEAGTPPIAPAIGLGAAVDFLDAIGMEAIRDHDAALVAYAYQRLQELDGVTVLGPPPNYRMGLVSFTVKGIHPHDLAQVLDHHGIAIRAGHHCAQPLHERLGIVASARASFCLYNTTDEVDQLIEGIRQAQKLFRS